MLVRFNETGQIIWVQSDYDTQKAIDAFLAEPFSLHAKGTKLPAMPLFDGNGVAIIGPDGKQIIDSPGTKLPVIAIETHYIVNPTTTPRLAKRPSLRIADTTVAADGEQGVTIRFVEPGASIKINGDAYAVDGDELTFATHDPGVYIFETVFPYRYSVFKVTAT